MEGREGGRTGEREKRKEVARPHTAGKVATWMTRRRVGRGNERARWNSTGQAEGRMGGGEVQWNRVYSLCRAYGYALFFYRSLTPLRSAVAFTTSLATIRLRSQGRSCAIFARSERSARFSSQRIFISSSIALPNSISLRIGISAYPSLLEAVAFSRIQRYTV